MFNLNCSHLSIFLYFYLIIEHMDRIVKELYTSTKQKFDLVGGGDTSLTKPKPQPQPHILCTRFTCFFFSMDK